MDALIAIVQFIAAEFLVVLRLAWGGVLMLGAAWVFDRIMRSKLYGKNSNGDEVQAISQVWKQDPLYALGTCVVYAAKILAVYIWLSTYMYMHAVAPIAEDPATTEQTQQ